MFSNLDSEVVIVNVESQSHPSICQEKNDAVDSIGDDQTNSSRNHKRPAPKQKEISEEIEIIHNEISHLERKQRTGIFSNLEAKTLAEKYKNLTSLRSELKKLEDAQKRAKIHREKTKEQIKKVVDLFPA